MRNTETAYFAMGCFWGAERLFSKLDGVKQTEVGYMGGHLENPSYQQVCTDTTDHAETVRVVFDPAQISYRQLLEVFFSHHNPTTLNRQGGDVGSQYRSQIFPTTADQEHTAQTVLLDLRNQIRDLYGAEPVTEIASASPLPAFYPAEEYHQRYLEKNPFGYCSIKDNGLMKCN
ncbi:MAG: peptide-methionine (S)-S-oxide reductase MsrA [Varibaculum cambriense]